ncbi:hypothetical protein BOTNAR_0020g00350 [Botryotinia narcissicola]|uniref:Uncharacterized protein n=1 Tax=Botryotinia narcissicola TaxID=278944 RepID=A0A4Z1JHP6_9HELO|nr:hypothetical protein BOTNAR_0020g00350 [Botryotinia narcissicola]
MKFQLSSFGSLRNGYSSMCRVRQNDNWDSGSPAGTVTRVQTGYIVDSEVVAGAKIFYVV